MTARTSTRPVRIEELLELGGKAGYVIPPARREEDRVEPGQVYKCPKCMDTGYRNNIPIFWDGREWFGLLAWKLAGVPFDKINWCDCEYTEDRRANYQGTLANYQTTRLAGIFRNSGIPARFADFTLLSIPAMYREGKKDALNAASQYMEHSYATTTTGQKREGLFFIGKPGTGKTGILSVVFQDIIKRGVAGLWIECYHFLKEIQAEYSKEGSQAHEKLQAAKTCAVLFLDDFGDPDRRKNGSGIQPETDDKRQIMWELVDYRHGNGLPMLITSNLSRDEFTSQWGERMASRLWEACRVVQVAGVDLRQALS